MMKKPKGVKGWILRAAVGIVLFVLLLLLIAGVTFGVLIHQGRKNLMSKTVEPQVLETAPEPETTQALQEVLLEEGEISYEGQIYRYKDSLINILCMGVDRKSLSNTVNTYGNGGQADAIMLVSIDTDTGEITILNISRETMADINLYTASGNYAGTDRRQICLAYAYGDGRVASCENVSLAVNRLLYGVPIQGYAAVSISAISVMNDAVGGVEVSLTQESAGMLNHRLGTSYEPGETVRLSGKEAYEFIHYRQWQGDDVPIDANNSRMDRQRQYVVSMAKQVMSESLNNLGLPVELFQILSDYTVTDLDAADISYLTSVVLKNGMGQLNMRTVPGEVVEGEGGYANYIVDEQALRELVLEIFYEAE